jgi:peptide-methionine (S)-S-oxide reductase
MSKYPSSRWLARAALPALLAAVLLVGCGVPPARSPGQEELRADPASAQEEARTVPAPQLDVAAGPTQSEVAVLAGGCFWGVQGVFQHVSGVSQAVSGYAGGSQETAEYEAVSSGRTGHAESVQITFDPQKISYGRLLQIYFSVAHDPTEVDRQGPDVGTQYRSAIFPTSDEQARVAKAYIDQLNQAGVFDKPIATRIEPDRAFYPAEEYHQDFLIRNPHHPYIVINDLPKIASLKRLQPDVYRAEPVLVAAEGSP